MKTLTLTMAIMACFVFIGCNSNTNPEDVKTPDENIAKGIELFENGDYDQAKQLFNEVIKDYPEYPESVDISSLYIDSILFKEAMIKEAKRLEDSIYYTNNTIKIIQLYTSRPNSAGGVDLHIVWKNNTGKSIKYIVFEAEAYNGVDDKVNCTIRDYSSFRGQITGPVKNGETKGYGTYWSCAWYNSTIKSAKLVKVNIEFMNDEDADVVIEGDNLKYI